MGAAWHERLVPNIELDEQLLPVDKMIATYASSQPMTAIAFWLLVLKNISLRFLGDMANV